MKLPSSLLAITLLFMSSCTDMPSGSDSAKVPSVDIPEGPFMGVVPSDTPQILFPEFISTNMGEYNGTFNPEGNEFYYTLSVLEYDAIVSSELQSDNTWSRPEIVPFAAPYKEWDPVFSPDGKRVYYSSHRPTEPNGPTDKCTIWFVEREGDQWKEPEYLPLYGPKPGNYFVSETTSGNLYFNIWSTGDLFRAEKVDTGYVVETLGDIVNSENGDGDPFVAPDESYLIFRSYRPGGVGSGDFWISFREDGIWGEPENLGEPINSKYNEMCPYVTTDGKLFIFSSGRFEQEYYERPPKKMSEVADKLNTHDNGQQNIYTIDASFIEEMRKK